MGDRASTIRNRMIVVRPIIFILMVSIARASTEEFPPSGVFSERRGSTGPVGTRGKNSPLPGDEKQLSKRTPMGFQAVLGKESSMIGRDEDGELFSEETAKRAPMGFQGMRGKKNNLPMTGLGDTYPRDSYGKRAPMGFQGTRGKKTSPRQDEYYKRAPMGFQGMRGKKSLQQILDELNERASAKREDEAPGREKETFALDYPDDYASRVLPVDDYRTARDKKLRLPRGWEKKAPMGFQGMRGKKMILDPLRGPNDRDAVDFHGRKDAFDNYLEYPNDSADYEAKRADGRMLFRRTTSKGDEADVAELYRFDPAADYKDPSNPGNNLAAYEIEKRSPFGPVRLAVRGKKSPRWELRGKFVGVRGKKAASPHSRTVERGQATF